MILNSWLEIVRDCIYNTNDQVLELDGIAIGSGSTPVKKSDTGLETLIEKKGVSSKSKISDGTSEYVCIWTPAQCNGMTITEAAVTDNVMPGPPLEYANRKVFPAIVCDGTFSVRITVYTKVEDNSR